MARLFSPCLSLAAFACMATTAFAQCHDCQNGVGGAGAGTGVGGGRGWNASSWTKPYTEESSPDIFYNYYQPGNGGMPAAAFPAPYPTPPLVGHQYTTYQPFMPNEWLYMHSRSYYQGYNDGRGLNRTKVVWHGTPIRTDLKNLRKFFSIPR